MTGSTVGGFRKRARRMVFCERDIRIRPVRSSSVFGGYIREADGPFLSLDDMGRASSFRNSDDLRAAANT